MCVRERESNVCVNGLQVLHLLEEFFFPASVQLLMLFGNCITWTVTNICFILDSGIHLKNTLCFSVLSLTF